MSVNFDKMNLALAQLKSAISKEPLNDLERDGINLRFRYTIEMLWKIAKKVLAENGVSAIAPKDVIRELANVGWINNPQEFIEYLKMRNEISHSYKEEVAKQVYEAAIQFAVACESIVKVLKEKSN